MILELFILLLILAFTYSGCYNKIKNVNFSRGEISETKKFVQGGASPGTFGPLEELALPQGIAWIPTVLRRRTESKIAVPLNEKVERLNVILNSVYDEYYDGLDPGVRGNKKKFKMDNTNELKIDNKIVVITRKRSYDENTIIQLILHMMAEELSTPVDDVYLIESDLFKIAYTRGYYDPFKNMVTDS